MPGRIKSAVEENRGRKRRKREEDERRREEERAPEAGRIDAEGRKRGRGSFE